MPAQRDRHPAAARCALREVLRGQPARQPACSRPTSATIATTTSCRIRSGRSTCAAAHAMNQKYLAAIRAHRSGRAVAGGSHLVRHLPVRARARSARRALSVPPAADQPGRQPAHRDAGARLGHQRAAVRDRRGLRALAEAARRARRVDGPGDRQHARGRDHGRRAAARRDGKGAGAARRDGRAAGAGQPVLRADQAVSGGSSPRPTASGSRPSTRGRSTARCCPPTGACAISCATSTCRRRAAASRGRRCPTGRRGTRTTCRSTRRRT